MCSVCTLLPVSTYVDRPETSAVTGGHVLVERLNRVGAGHLTVLLVHVVGTRARVVADPDTEVLDLEGVLLGDLPLHQYAVPFPTRCPNPFPLTLFNETISPLAFLTFRSLARKYQKRLFATTSFGAKMRMR